MLYVASTTAHLNCARMSLDTSFYYCFLNAHKKNIHKSINMLILTRNMLRASVLFLLWDFIQMEFWFIRENRKIFILVYCTNFENTTLSSPLKCFISYFKYTKNTLNDFLNDFPGSAAWSGKSQYLLSSSSVPHTVPLIRFSPSEWFYMSLASQQHVFLPI